MCSLALPVFVQNHEFFLNSFSDIDHVTAHMNNNQKHLQTSKGALNSAPVRQLHRSKQQQRQKLHSAYLCKKWMDDYLFMAQIFIDSVSVSFLSALLHKEVLFKPVLPNAASLMQFTFCHTQLCRAATLPHLFCSSVSLV